MVWQKYRLGRLDRLLAGKFALSYQNANVINSKVTKSPRFLQESILRKFGQAYLSSGVIKPLSCCRSANDQTDQASKNGHAVSIHPIGRRWSGPASRRVHRSNPGELLAFRFIASTHPVGDEFLELLDVRPAEPGTGPAPDRPKCTAG